MENKEMLQETEVVEMAQELQKLEEQDFEKLQTLNQEFMNLTMDLGALEVQKMAFEQRREALVKSYEEKQQESEAFTSELRKKYGDINININTGEFVKVDSTD